MASEASIKLPRETWAGIMQVLAQRPYAEVAPLLAEMDRQLKDSLPNLGEASFTTEAVNGVSTNG